MVIKSRNGLKGSEYILSERNSEGIVQFNHAQTFGNSHINGLQSKGMARIFDGETFEDKFVKLDTLVPKRGQWQDNFDYKYSSISETIVSLFIKNTQPQKGFDSVQYDFDIYQQNDSQISGTSSDNFLSGPDEMELLYSTPYPVEGETTTIGLNDFVAQHLDKPQSKAQRLQGFINGYIKAGVDPKAAKTFLVQQAGFDLLMANQDRLNNPGNFVFKYDVANKSLKPVNLDYGRCLQINWPQTMEDRYTKDEFYDEDVAEYAQNFANGSDAIIGDKMAAKPDELKSILEDFDFKPFRVDMSQLKADLENFRTKVISTKLGIDNFVNLKVDAFVEFLETGPYRDLYTNISHETQLEKDTTS